MKLVSDPWKSNMGQSVLPLGQNLQEILEKYNNELYFFYKSWLDFSKSTAWVNLYCSWFKFLKDPWNRKKHKPWWKLTKNPRKDNVGQAVLSSDNSDYIIST